MALQYRIYQDGDFYYPQVRDGWRTAWMWRPAHRFRYSRHSGPAYYASVAGAKSLLVAIEKARRVVLVKRVVAVYEPGPEPDYLIERLAQQQFDGGVAQQQSEQGCRNTETADAGPSPAAPSIEEVPDAH